MNSYQSYEKRFLNFFIGGALLLAIIAGLASSAPAQADENAKPPAAGKKPLPDLTLPTLDGKKWSLAEQRGRVVLMNFWATWCLPCREEVPALVGLSKKYKKDGLEVVGVTIDSENLKAIRKFVGEFKVSYPILMPRPDSLITQQEAVPMTLLIDADGILEKKYLGAAEAADFEADLKLLLDKLAAEKAKKAPLATRKTTTVN